MLAWVDFFDSYDQKISGTDPIFLIGKNKSDSIMDLFLLLYKFITKGMLPKSLNYTSWPIFGNPASRVMSVKLKYICSAYRKHPDQAHLWMTAERKNWAHPLQVGLEPADIWPYSHTLFFFFATMLSMQDFSFPTRDETHAPYSGSSES